MYSVLLVDDEPFILDGLEKILPWEEHNLRIVGRASNGEQAYELIRQHRPDIVISDITMPRMSGLELITTCRDQGMEQHFIILSGYSEFDYVKQGLRLGIENYLLKPINAKELETTLSTTLEKLESGLEHSAYPSERSILTENIFFRWIHPIPEPEEFESRAQLLGIPLNYQNYRVTIIGNYDSQNGSHRQLTATMKSLDPFLTRIDELMGCFYDLTGHIVLLLGTPPEKTERSAVIMETLSKELEHDHLFLTVGRTVSNYRQVHESYSDALALQEYRLVYPTGTLLCLDGKPQTGDRESFPQISPEKLRSLLLSGDDRGLRAFIADQFESSHRISGCTPDGVRRHAVEILLQIDEISRESHIRFPEGGRGTWLSRLFALETREQLVDFICSTTGDVLNAMDSRETSPPSIISDILRYIDRNIAAELSLKTLGGKFNINPTYLGQLFHRKTGEYFNSYLGSKRMEKARKLLLDSYLKANEIAGLVGFSDPNYFYRTFRKYSGLSPSEFRRSHRRAGGKT